MEVIPLTLAISLLLSLTFIALFVREFSRPSRAGAEHDSLLPLEEDLPAPAHDHPEPHAHDHSHAADEVCASKRTDGKCCASCQRRKFRATERAGRSADGSAPIIKHQS